MTSRPVGPLNFSTCYGALAFGGVTMHRLAWDIPDLSELWGSPPTLGDNRQVPDQVASIAYDFEFTETTTSFGITVVGSIDKDGVATANAVTGLQANLAYLHSVLTADPGNIGRTRTAVFTLPSGSTRTAAVQIRRLSGQISPGSLFRGSLIVDMPDPALYLGG